MAWLKAKYTAVAIVDQWSEVGFQPTDARRTCTWAGAALDPGYGEDGRWPKVEMRGVGAFTPALPRIMQVVRQRCCSGTSYWWHASGARRFLWRRDRCEGSAWSLKRPGRGAWLGRRGEPRSSPQKRLVFSCRPSPPTPPRSVGGVLSMNCVTSPRLAHYMRCDLRAEPLAACR